jgi:hypothetical protein
MRWILGGFVLLGLALLNSWAAAALYFDLPFGRLNAAFAAVYVIAVMGVLVWVRPFPRSWGICLAGFLLVLGWWLTLKPSNTGNWQPDAAETAWAEINGDIVTIHNVRNCDYRTETDYTPRWETRTVDVSQLQGVDIFITYWGSPWIAHPILSFQFGDGQHVAFSIEARKQVGQEYSAVLGFFRQYGLTYIAADERDVIRLRTNYRTGEEVYLFRTRMPLDRARALFMEYVKAQDRLRKQPEWYNALTTNCTTAIRRLQVKAIGDNVPPLDWRMFLNGRMDEMIYERGGFASDLPLPELKERGHINAAARAADKDPEFSRRIREGRPGF